MAKFRDKLAVFIVRRINVNPEKRDRAVKKFQAYHKIGILMPRILKRGYERVVHDADGTPLELYKKKGTSPKKLVYFLHGGGFIMGLNNVYRNFHLEIVRTCPDVAVAMVDYRTAPKHTYPAAHDDALKGWEFLQSDLGFEPQNIVLIGDSAGGNLALSLLLRLKDENKPLPAAAVAMSAWVDFAATGNSYKANYNKDILFGRRKSEIDGQKIEKLLKSSIFSYAGESDRNDPYLSPVLADYHSLPPVMLVAGADEMPLDDTLAVAKKIEEAGGSVRLIVEDGMFHVFPLFFSISPTAKKTLKEIMLFIKEHTDS